MSDAERKQCSALKKNQQERCSLRAKVGSEYCGNHEWLKSIPVKFVWTDHEDNQ